MAGAAATGCVRTPIFERCPGLACSARLRAAKCLAVSLSSPVSGLYASSGMPLRKRLEIEHAEQRVAAADVGVEETERLAGLDGLDPQRDLGELDRHRIAVDAMDDIAAPRRAARGGTDRSSASRRAAGRRVDGRSFPPRRGGSGPEPQAGSITFKDSSASGSPGFSATLRSITGSSACLRRSWTRESGV